MKAIIKAKWALAGEKGLVDIKWYDKKWFITTRKILFPIDLAVHIVIGTITAPFKFIKSFAMGFRTAARITKDIYSDTTNQHFYSNGGFVLHSIAYIANFFNTKNKKMFDTGDFFPVNHIYVDEKDNKITLQKLNRESELKKQFIWESSIPISNLVNKPIEGKDKSLRYHIQTILGLRSIKPIEEYNNYSHGTIPRYPRSQTKSLNDTR